MSRFCAILNRFAAALLIAAGVCAAAMASGAGLSRAHAADAATAEQAEETRAIVYGQADAPVTIYEYASLTCPHCANFHTEVLPRLKESLLDTGKAKLVFKDFPLDQLALRAAVMVRCNEGPRRKAMLDVLFRTQPSWSGGQDPIAALLNIGRAAGMTDEDLQACFNNQEIIDGVIKHRLDGEQRYQVNSTPSFVIDGTLYRGDVTVEQIEQVVESLQP